MVGFCIITSTWGSVKLAFRCPRGGVLKPQRHVLKRGHQLLWIPTNSIRIVFTYGWWILIILPKNHMVVVWYQWYLESLHCLVFWCSLAPRIWWIWLSLRHQQAIVSQRWLSFLSPLIYWVTVWCKQPLRSVWTLVGRVFNIWWKWVSSASAADCESLFDFTTLWVTFLAQAAAAPIVVVVSAARWPLSHAGGAVVLPGR